MLQECTVTPLSADDPPEPVKRIARLLEAGGHVVLGELADRFDLSPWDLTRLFHRRYGLTPSHYRREAMIQRAIAALAESEASLAAIAADAGFADQSHFGRALRAATGQSPGAIRRSAGLG